jgi:hypothetical protein
MLRFRIILILVLLVHLTKSSDGQRGYEVIEKAEQKFNEGKYNASLRLLKKARKMDYGVCGNAYFTAYESIDLIKAKVYLAKGKYAESRNAIDSIYSLAYIQDYDSIRIRSYQYQFGKESFKKMFLESFDSAELRCDPESTCNILIHLADGEFLMLNHHINMLFLTHDSLSREAALKNWKELFLNSDIYRMIVD